MRIGTKSVLYGAHCAVVHPWFLAAAWRKLYGFPWDIRLWCAFWLHDAGYFSKRDMDGLDGKRTLSLVQESWPSYLVSPGGPLRPHIPDIGRSGMAGNSPGFCVADKLAFVLIPAWFISADGQGYWRTFGVTCFGRRNDRPVCEHFTAIESAQLNSPGCAGMVDRPEELHPSMGRRATADEE